MVSQDDFPDKWSCESDQKKVRVEVRVPRSGLEGAGRFAEETTVGHDWIEIPTQSVELWVEKGEAAEIQRTAKVVYPTQWGEDSETVLHNSPRRLITQYSSTDASPFMFARISFQHDDGSWVYTHFGWIGGVGGTESSEVGTTSKMWVYDVSELLTGVPLSETFNDPTPRQALERIVNLTNDNTPIPVSGATLVGPDVEEDQAVEGERDSSGDGYRETSKTSDTTYYSRSQDGTELPSGQREASMRSYGSVPGNEIGSKTFVSNHDTLLDIYEWFEERTDATMHFETAPGGESLELVADVTPSRRTFTQTEVLDRALEGADFFEATALSFHEPVSVLKNNALYEMKPMNTVYVNGSTGVSTLGEAALEAGLAVTETGLMVDLPEPSETYPTVKVQVPSLVEAAGGVELAPELVESDAETLDRAENVARRKMRKLLEEPSEGEIVLGGVPTIRPFDRVRAFEVCNDEVVYEPEPIEYEVESVKHEKSARSFYTVRLRVSIWANDTHIETVEKKMVEA